MSSLEPIDSGVPEEGQALAQALRTLFDALGISMRRYSARCHTDFGTVSRYLSGKRVPPWGFVRDLLANVAEHRGQPASDETVAALRQMHARALGVGNGTRRVVELQQALEEADQQVRESISLERLLRQALQEQERQVSQLRVELQSLRAARAADRQAESKEVELLISGYQDLKDERDELERELNLIRKQLAETTTARIAAEEKCAQLERQLEEAEEQEVLDFRNASEQERERADAAAEKLLREREEATRRLQSLEKEMSLLLKESASSETLAEKIGYGPRQVLRRVDSANKKNPGSVEEILARAIDIQTPTEITLTAKLLKSMPGYMAYMFQDLQKRTTRPDINSSIGRPDVS
ncbi:hypothetical protein OG625_30420 [Streptomyces sp. NBC_01351]|uniref:hypothetical protein n=1 Tax=Streptomyces sp. NBC_01351 TaxID=2903833 RepID=UPI002E2EDB7A|nr:hypothetical protein [Streptomyces sp. NBC_01351]